MPDGRPSSPRSEEIRIAVIGTAGAGKTTLACALAQRLGLPHIELDAINWQAGWVGLNETDVDEFKRRVAAATSAKGWVLDGNYGPVKDIVWHRATHLVWLDYSLPLILRRVIRRSLRRLVFREVLWNGNREGLRQLFAPGHPVWWAWSTWARRRRELEARAELPQFSHLKVIRLVRPLEEDEIVRRLAEG